MGRGRQKAKQTKVARKLKYFSPDTDLDALQRELTSDSSDHDAYSKYVTDDDDDDPYSEYASKYADPCFDDDNDAKDLREDPYSDEIVPKGYTDHVQ